MDRLAVIRTEAERFASVLAQTPGESRVPTCPDWDASDLLWHLTEVHLFWAGVLRSGALTEDDVAALETTLPARPESLSDALELRRAATGDLIETLRELDDAQPRWSWWEPEQTVGFTRRMQTYEATMHRVDAELAAGLKPGPIADDVASGAVDHCADVMWGWIPDWATYTPTATIELRAADIDRSWLVEVGRWVGTGPESGKHIDQPRAVRAETGSPSAVVSGTAQHLALWAWGRGSSIETLGDARAVAAIQDVVAAGIQ